MKEKILALLTAKFAGVRKDGLARLAGALALNATTEEEAGALVDRLTADAVNEFITDYRKDVDTEVSTATKTHETTLKKKYNFVEKEGGQSGKKGKTKDDDDDDDDQSQAPAWAKALIEQNKQLAEKVAAFEGSKTTETRLQQLEAKLTKTPEAFKAKALKDFKRMQFDSDEAFNEYLGEVETDITALNQELADSKLAGGTKPIFGSKGADGVSSAVSSYVAEKTSQDKPLEGKPL